jgi:hypothetical protein
MRLYLEQWKKKITTKSKKSKKFTGRGMKRPLFPSRFSFSSLFDFFDFFDLAVKKIFLKLYAENFAVKYSTFRHTKERFHG